MLKRLRIKNVALIEGLDMCFEDGFNVLTGETGAGKSIIIDAVNLALGERASRELIKSGADKARVEAEFDISRHDELKRLLDEYELEYDNELVICRELSVSGKNVCRINGTLVNLNTLKQVSDLLVDVHGQHEHQSLLMQSRHIDFLDGFGAKEIYVKREAAAESYRCIRELRTRLMGGFSSESERERELDILRYQIAEIERAKLTEDEEASLMEERGVLMNAERIMSALQLSAQAVSGEGGAFSLMGEAKGAMQGISQISKEYDAAFRRIEEAYYAIEDIGYTLRDMRNGFEYDPMRIDEIERRLEVYSTLKKKYGRSIFEIDEFYKNAVSRVEELEGEAETRAGLERELELAEKQYRMEAEELSALRHEAAQRLETALLEQLHDLGMEKARFKVGITRLEEITAKGVDRVEFLLSANAGEQLKPLEKVASGGEMSRIMLSFKAIAAEADMIPTLIFDEIDTGISGRIAAVVGSKMADISRSRQVLCITHLPQIAALADAHYMVEKTDDGNSAHTDLKLLTMEERYSCLARMMGGEQGSKLAYEHARELIASAKKEKNERRIT